MSVVLRPHPRTWTDRQVVTDPRFWAIRYHRHTELANALLIDGMHMRFLRWVLWKCGHWGIRWCELPDQEALKALWEPIAAVDTRQTKVRPLCNAIIARAHASYSDEALQNVIGENIIYLHDSDDLLWYLRHITPDVKGLHSNFGLWQITVRLQMSVPWKSLPLMADLAKGIVALWEERQDYKYVISSIAQQCVRGSR